MSEPISDWGELQSEWQSYQPDMKKIKKKINWVSWRMGAVLVFDVLAIVGYCLFLYYQVILDDKPLSLEIWLYAMGVASVYGVYLDFKIRLPIFRSVGDSTKDVLQLYLKRVEAGVTIGKLGEKFSWAVLILFWIWAITNHLTLPAEAKLNNPKGIILASIWIVGIAGIFIWYKKKKQKEHQKLRSLWQGFIETDEVES